MEAIRCAIRKISVAAHPEEVVRQELLLRMIEKLEYPASLIAVEKELAKLPHLALSKGKLPDRRADIICYGKGIHRSHILYPLLLIECKAAAINSNVLNQIAGYNHYIGSCFICVANRNEIHTGWYNPVEQRYNFVPFLPSYPELLKSVQRKECAE